MSDGNTDGMSRTGRTLLPWPAVIAVIIFASPVYDAVSRGTEPRLGGWASSATAIVAASAAGMVVLLAANWIILRERRGWAGDPAPMVYRPAILPVAAFTGAVLKNLPAALTEWLLYVYVGWLIVSLGGVVTIQRRGGRAWSWWVAVPVGFVVSLVGLLGAFCVTRAITGVWPK